jgi:hypothetical protein
MRLLHVTTASIAALLCFNGCLATPVEGSGSAPVVGHWSYAGVQNTGNNAVVNGALVFTSSTAFTYGGSLDVIETASGNQQRRIVGPLVGRMSSTTAVDFEVTIGLVRRQHIGTVVADTLHGTWFELGTNNVVVAGGTYRAVRTSR